MIGKTQLNKAEVHLNQKNLLKLTSRIRQDVASGAQLSGKIEVYGNKARCMKRHLEEAQSMQKCDQYKWIRPLPRSPEIQGQLWLKVNKMIEKTKLNEAKVKCQVPPAGSRCVKEKEVLQVGTWCCPWNIAATEMLKNQVQQLCNQDEAETPRSRCTRSGATPPIVSEQVHKEAQPAWWRHSCTAFSQDSRFSRPTSSSIL